MQLEEMKLNPPFNFGRAGDRWKASAAGAHVPAPQVAMSALRSAWSEPHWSRWWRMMMPDVGRPGGSGSPSRAQ